MKAHRGEMLLSALVVCGGVSIVCLYYFGWGMFYAQDLWRVNVFAACLIGGLLAAVAATIAGETVRRRHKEAASTAGETVRRRHKEAASTAAGAFLILAARILLGTQVMLLLYCNAGPVRTVWTAVLRRSVTYGMARDLPMPPPAQ